MEPKNNTIKDILAELEITHTSSTDNRFTMIGKIKDEYAIVVVSQPPLILKNILNMAKTSEDAVCSLSNDVFSCYEIKNEATYTFRLIHPASEEKVKKYTMRSNEYESESYEKYQKILKEKLEKEKDNNWIRNIINHCQINSQDDHNLEAKKYKKDTKGNQKHDDNDINTQEGTDKAINTKENDEHKDTNTDNSKVLQEESQTKSNKIKPVQTSNDIEQKTEFKEEILYNDEEFVVIPNYKWNKKSINNLYLILLFKDENLYTIREIKDYKLLERARKVAYQTIKKHYNLDQNNVYLFFHYHPTYFSLHLHVCNANFYGPFSSVGKAILLDDVIENIKVDTNFYAKRDMFMIVRK